MQTSDKLNKQGIATLLFNSNGGHIKDCNTPFLTLFAIDKASLDGIKFPDLIKGDQSVEKFYRHRDESKKGFTVESTYVFTGKNDSTWMGRLNISYFAESGYHVGQIHPIDLDIGQLDYKVISEVFSQLGEFVLITDNDTEDPFGPNVVFMNKAYLDHTGFTLGDLQDEGLCKLLDDVKQKDILEQSIRELKQGKTTTFTLLQYKKSGEAFWMKTKMSPIRDDEGSIQYWLSIGRDITESRKQKQELQRNNERLQKAQQISKMGFFEHWLEMDKVFASDGLYNILGIPNKANNQINLEDYLALIHEDDLAAVKSGIDKLIKKGEPNHVVHRIRRQDTGELRYIENMGEAEVDEHGKPNRLFGVMQDVTDKKKKEKA